MSGFIEPEPHLITANPGGPDDPLGESILDHSKPQCRIFEPQTTAVVIGRHQQLRREVHVSACQQDAVPMYRRVSGGGAVVLAPGMLVIALRLYKPERSSSDLLCSIARMLIAALEPFPFPPLLVRGYGDIALCRDGQERKVLGASLRQSQHFAYYLGVLLVQDASALMRRYLQAPSRQPAYRAERDHAQFCDALAGYGGAISPLAMRLRAYIQEQQMNSVSHAHTREESPCRIRLPS